MALKIGINGFGRIGRLVFRAALENPNVEFVGVNDIVPPDNLAYLLKYDSIHRTFSGKVEAKDDGIVVNGKFVPCYSIRNPAEVEVLRAVPDFVLLGVDADPHVRFARMRSRDRIGDPTTFEQFAELEARETHSTDPTTQQLLATWQLADVVVQNDTTLEALEAAVLGVLADRGRSSI